jgi:ankyrin repeat protein
MNIFQAAQKGNNEILELWILNGDINLKDKNGMTALMHAIDNNKINTVEYLLRKKADINVQDKYGQTPIMLAAGRNEIKIIEMLIKAKADLNIISKSGLTAYGFAKENGNDEAVRVIKSAGGK